MINTNIKRNPNPNPNPNLNPYPTPKQKPNHYPHSYSLLSEISSQEQMSDQQYRDLGSYKLASTCRKRITILKGAKLRHVSEFGKTLQKIPSKSFSERMIYNYTICCLLAYYIQQYFNSWSQFNWLKLLINNCCFCDIRNVTHSKNYVMFNFWIIIVIVIIAIPCLPKKYFKNSSCLNECCSC